MQRLHPAHASKIVLWSAFALATSAGFAHAQNPIRRVSVSSGGAEGDRNSGIYPPAISSDGRFIAFDSDAKTLAPNDTNNTIDVYVRDQTTGVVTCISVDSTGASGNGASFDPALSADGRYVAFFSDASNLITNDANQASDVFVRDRDPGADGVFDEPDAFTFRVSVSSSGAEADGPSYSAAISADGMVIVFATDATNLGANDKNNSTDVFLHDRNDGTTTRMSLDSQGRGGKDDSYSPSISADGKIVTFASIATNLVPSDLNGKADLFLRDRANGTTERLSVDSIGIEGDATTYGDAALSSDGSIVAFLSEASNLVDNDTSGSLDVFVRIRAIFSTTVVSIDSSGSGIPRGANSAPTMTADGSLVAFSSGSTKLVSNDTNGWDDCFLHNRTTGSTVLLSRNCKGELGSRNSRSPVVTPDGTLVIFNSEAVNLVGDDSNGVTDVFVLDRGITPTDASWSNYGSGFAGTYGVPSLALSADPEFGASLTVDIGNSARAFTAAFLLIGNDDASIPTKDGGTLLVDLVTMIPLALWPFGLSYPADIPDDVDLCGATFYLQVVEIDHGAAYGLSFSAGLELVIGN